MQLVFLCRLKIRIDDKTSQDVKCIKAIILTLDV